VGETFFLVEIFAKVQKKIRVSTLTEAFFLVENKLFWTWFTKFRPLAPTS
jgi:hypothetical protein